MVYLYCIFTFSDRVALLDGQKKYSFVVSNQGNLKSLFKTFSALCSSHIALFFGTIASKSFLIAACAISRIRYVPFKFNASWNTELFTKITMFLQIADSPFSKLLSTFKFRRHGQFLPKIKGFSHSRKENVDLVFAGFIGFSPVSPLPPHGCSPFPLWL
jgi:hypothetical protein